MHEDLSFFLADVASYIGLIPSILALFRLKNSLPEYRQLTLLVWGGTTISLLAIIVGTVLHKPNLFLLHIYTIFDFILLTLIFKPVLGARLTRFLTIAFSLFAATNSIFFEHLRTENVLNRSLSALILMFYALSFFTKTLREMKIQKLENEPLFWISIGVLFYNAGSFFIFLFSHYLTPIQDLWYTYFGIHAIFTILLYVCYTIALWVQPKQ
jgi:hypothetical protein